MERDEREIEFGLPNVNRGGGVSRETPEPKSGMMI
jgi:hypothetical protein